MTKRTVLIPVDGSDFDRQILATVRDFFYPPQTHLILLRAAAPPVTLAPEVTFQPMTGRVIPELYETYRLPLEQRYIWSTQEEESCRAELQLAMQEEVASLQQAGYTVAAEVVFGDPAEQIIRYVKTGQVDLIAMTTHGRSGVARFVLGSVAEQVLRQVSVPVMLLHTGEPSAEKLTGREPLLRSLQGARRLRLVVATDGSTFGQTAIQLATELTKALQAYLTVLVVTSDGASVAHNRQVMEDVTAQLVGLTTKPELVPLVGYTDEVILKHLEEYPADLLVIGAFHDRGAGGLHAIGAMAQRVVQQAPVAVLMAKGHQPALRKILACADVDDPIVVEFAAQFAKRVGAQLDLLHVVPMHVAAYLAKPASAEISVEVALQQETGLAAVLQNWLAQLTTQGYTPDHLHLCQGSVAETILAMARSDDYDLVIVGSQSDAGHFVHTVAQRMVSFAEQPVLVLRTRQRG